MKSLSSVNLKAFSNEQMQTIKGGYKVLGSGSCKGRSLEDRDYGEGKGGMVCDVVCDSE